MANWTSGGHDQCTGAEKEVNDFDLSQVGDEVRRLNPDVFQEKPKKRSKYRNIRQEAAGMHFDSGKEAEDAYKFMVGVRAGEYLVYLHHVTVSLPGNIKMELDHLLINNQLEIEVFDSKGGDATVTRDWKNKAKLFKATYGKEIRII
jgi:hypothetical protein